MEKKYIVGIDFGFSNTAAWVAPISGGIGYALRTRHGVHANDKVCLSKVYRNREGQYSLYLTHLPFDSFKDCPEKLYQNPERKEAFGAFARLIVLALIEKNPELEFNPRTKETNFYIGVASPNYWSEADRLEYQAFFIRALEEFRLLPVCNISEGLASFCAWGCSNESTLVIDYGPNAICYTLLDHGNMISDRNWYNSMLGASQVEQAILYDFIAKDEDRFYRTMNTIVEECHRTGNDYSYDDVLAYLINDIRVEKENVFKHGIWPFMSRMDFSSNMYDRCGGCNSGWSEDAWGIMKVGGSLLEMPSFVNYQAKVKADFELVKNETEELVGKEGLRRILLTGNGSLMTWVRPVVIEVFGKTVETSMGNEPAYTVAQGIVRYVQKMRQ